MSVDEALGQAQELLSIWIREALRPEPNRLDVVLGAVNVESAVQALIDAHWGYLATITGVDLGPDSGETELLYHFCSGAAVLTLRTRVARRKGGVASIHEIIPSASIYEQEVAELFGVEFEGTPYLEHLFLPDNWPNNVFPLLKDAQLDKVKRD